MRRLSSHSIAVCLLAVISCAQPPADTPPKPWHGAQPEI